MSGTGRFDPQVLAPDPQGRAEMLAILDAALDAVDPYAAVARAVERRGDVLRVDGRSFDLARCRDLYLLGAGKAGAPMARALEDRLGPWLRAGLVVVKEGHTEPTRVVQILEAGHPVPDDRAVDAGRRLLALAHRAQEDDLVLCVLSGGGSALLEVPAPGITLADLQAMTQVLLGCGATIHEINVLRKHLSQVKGGQLARAVHPARLVTLVLSDVVGNPLDVIASGPTVPDASTWQDAWAVVTRYELEDRLPQAVVARIQAGLRGEIPETPKPGDPVFERTWTLVVADNAQAAQAARDRGASLGYHALVLTTYLEAEAAEVGKMLAALGKEVALRGNPVPKPACLVLGGESTVVLGERPGKGGRNQEVALAAALALAGMDHRILVAALATDGTDGPTDSAGGLVDGTTCARARTLGMDPRDHLRRHDAYPLLRTVGDMLLTGPTRTNVNDLYVVLVR